MMLIMNDNDFEEKQLLNALNDSQTQYRQQQYNFDYQLNNNNNNNSNHLSDYRGHGRNHYQEQHFDIESNQCQYDRSQSVQSIEPYQFDPDSSSSSSSHVSAGSMTAEEFLEEFLDDNNKKNDQQPNTMSADDNVDDRYPTKTDKKLLRKITFCETEHSNISNNNKRNLNHKVSKPNDASATVKPTHRRSKSAASDESSSNGDDDDTPYRVDEPTSADILCGQSRVCANHPGNQFFQRVLGEFAYRYDLASSKQAKMCMTKEIVARVHDNHGRFLKQKKGGMWEEISTVAARDKVSHALRTKVASWKRNQQQQQPQQQQQNQQQQQSQRRGSVTPPRGTRRRMSRSSIQSHRHRSSIPDTTPSLSSADIAPIPLDGHEASDAILSGLMKSQQEYYDTMNTILSGNSSRNHGSSSSHHNRGHSFPTYPSSHHHHDMQR